MGGLMRTATLVLLVAVMSGCGWQLVRKNPRVAAEQPAATQVVAPEPVPEVAEPAVEVARVPPAVQVHELDQLLSVYNAAGTMSPAQRRDLLATAGQRYADERSLGAGMHLAVLLLHDGSDEQVKRAARILDSALSRADLEQEKELVGLARLLQGLLRVNVQSSINNGLLAQTVNRRDEEIEDLKKQINALKSIEKSLYDRDIGSSPERK